MKYIFILLLAGCGTRKPLHSFPPESIWHIGEINSKTAVLQWNYGYRKEKMELHPDGKFYHIDSLYKKTEVDSCEAKKWIIKFELDINKKSI